VCAEPPAPAVIIGIDSVTILDHSFEAAREHSTLSETDITNILAQTATVAASGDYHPFKTTPMFDSTAISLGMPAV
jgi:hypothetical protein